MRSGASVATPPRIGGVLGEQSDDRLREQGGLLLALDLDGPLLNELVPAVALLVDREGLEARADARAGRHGCGVAHLVPAVVDAHLEAGLRLEELVAEAVAEAERQVAVGDRGAEGALGLRALHVHV